MQGVTNVNGSSPIPEGANLGLGVKSAAIRKLHIQGALTQTGNPYDMAINGRGGFKCSARTTKCNTPARVRFNTNANGQLVTIDGYLLDPAITVPQGTVEVTVNQTGQVFAKLDTEINARQIGQLNLANFANEAGLEPLGSNLYRETTASGTPVVGTPGRFRLRQDQPEISRSLERRSGQGNHRVDLGAARLRNERQGHPGLG